MLSRNHREAYKALVCGNPGLLSDRPSPLMPHPCVPLAPLCARVLNQPIHLFEIPLFIYLRYAQPTNLGSRHNQSNFNKHGVDAMVGRFLGGVVSAKGDIYARDGDSCIAAQNGACFFREPFKRGAEAVVSLDGMRWIDGVVVTIAVAQAETETYHVVAEQLAAVALVQDAINTTGGVFYLHLTARNAFIDQWIAILLPGLPEPRILTGVSVAARLLLAPQQTCGNPTPSQMLWMRARVMAALGPTATVQ